MIVERTRDAREATIHFRSVQVGRDYGASVEIMGGIIDGALIVLNPNADLVDGARVRVGVRAPSAPATGAPAITPTPSSPLQRNGTEARTAQ